MNYRSFVPVVYRSPDQARLTFMKLVAQERAALISTLHDSSSHTSHFTSAAGSHHQNGNFNFFQQHILWIFIRILPPHRVHTVVEANGGGKWGANVITNFPLFFERYHTEEHRMKKNVTRTTSSGSGWNSRAKLRLIEIEQVLRFLVQVSFVSQTRSLSRWLFASAVVLSAMALYRLPRLLPPSPPKCG